MSQADTAERFMLKSSYDEFGSQSRNQASNAVLCTEDQTFQIRQVQSSNSVLVVRPSEGRPGPDETGAFSPRLSIACHCPTTLELVLTKPHGAGLFKSRIPTYERFDLDDPRELEVTDDRGLSPKLDKLSLSDELPLSRNEFDQTWIDMCCFELNGQAYIPTPAVLLRGWSLLLNTATLEGLDFAKNFSIDIFEDSVEDGSCPFALLVAIITRLAEDFRQVAGGSERTVA